MSARDGRGLAELLAALDDAPPPPTAGRRRATRCRRGCRSTASSRSRDRGRSSPARCGAARSPPATRWRSSPAAAVSWRAACRCTIATTRRRGPDAASASTCAASTAATSSAASGSSRPSAAGRGDGELRRLGDDAAGRATAAQRRPAAPASRDGPAPGPPAGAGRARSSATPTGASGAAVVRLDGGSAAVEPHDRFILRSLSPVATVPAGRRPRRRARVAGASAGAHAAYCAALHDGDCGAALTMLVERAAAAGVAGDDLDALPGRPTPPPASGRGDRLTAAGAAARVDAETPGRRRHRAARRALVRRRHGGDDRRAGAGGAARAREGAAGAAAGRARRAGGAGRAVSRPRHSLSLLADLEQGGRVVESAGGYARGRRRDALGAPGGARRRGLRPPRGRALLAADASPCCSPKRRRQRRELLTVLDVLRARGRAVRVDKDLWFSAAAVDEARERLCEALARDPEITLAAVPRPARHRTPQRPGAARALRSRGAHATPGRGPRAACSARES